ncbi:flagellar basal body P-ring formation chaperone FlgA [uncultured Maricaulis sp.]|uniref:flagellar basal body P-ring formation chaperone FlgA n=1 Tax=uncultured Maricaulis sp. TaxID=174710 RepID=UPI0030D752B3|tara:strand:+ start:23953 stop:24882 length:930 start_codon:yes stop_codon:yes gene_type:complete
MFRASLLALACLTTAPALASEPVFLRQSLVVEGSQITLGDVFEMAGPEANTVLARSPAPGARLALDVNYVRQIAADHDLDWANASGMLRLTITRASRVLDADALTSMIEGELMAREGGHHEVQLANSNLALHAPVDTVGAPQIGTFNYDPRSGMLSADIIAWDGAEPVRVTGRAYETIDIPVLDRPIAAGEIVSDNDVRWVSQRSDRVRPDSVLNPDDIIGHQARRALRAGEALRGYDLQQAILVNRGDLVTLVFEARGIQLSVRARAMENAADGESVRFVNLQSNRTVEAMVDGPGRARVFASPAASF